MTIKDRYDAYEIFDLPGLRITMRKRDHEALDFHGNKRTPHPAELNGTAPKPLELYVLRGSHAPF